MICSKCGSEVSVGNSICPVCGNIAGEPEDKTAPMAKPVKAKKNKKKSKWKRIIIVAVIIIVIFLLIPTPETDENVNESTDSSATVFDDEASSENVNESTDVITSAIDDFASSEGATETTQAMTDGATEESKASVMKEEILSNSEQIKELSSSKKKKIDKAYKKQDYEKLADLYDDGDAAEKAYISSQAIEHFSGIINGYTYIDISDIEKLKSDYEQLTSSGANNEWLEVFSYALNQLIELYEERAKLPLAYSGPIPDNCVPTYLDVYVSVRIGDSQNAGEYLDYYGAYVKYDYLYGDYYPDYDSEMIIIKSTERLSEGINHINAVEYGTYDTVSRGFEETHRLFITYTDEQWQEFYDSQEVSNRRKTINDTIDTIEGFALQTLAENKVAAAEAVIDNALNAYYKTLYAGSWAEAYSECYIYIESEADGFLVSITFSDPDAAYQICWDLNCKYDSDKNGLVYKNGHCYIEYYSPSLPTEELYSDGSGLIYLKNGNLYWDDYKEDKGKNCTFSPFVR